jgi:hypothetical protein
MPVKENVLTRTADFIKWSLPKIEGFPQNYIFLFGDRLVEIQFDVLENLIEAYAACRFRPRCASWASTRLSAPRVSNQIGSRSQGGEYGRLFDSRTSALGSELSAEADSSTLKRAPLGVILGG